MVTLPSQADAKATQLPVFYVGWSLSIVICAGLDTIALAFTGEWVAVHLLPSLRMFHAY